MSWKAKSVSDQTWAYVFVVTGCVMVIVSRHFGLSEGIGGGIVGCGLNALTKAESQQQTLNVGHVDKVSQNGAVVEEPQA